MILILLVVVCMNFARHFLVIESWLSTDEMGSRNTLTLVAPITGGLVDLGWLGIWTLLLTSESNK